jgi:hypothetical protein
MIFTDALQQTFFFFSLFFEAESQVFVFFSGCGYSEGHSLRRLFQRRAIRPV